MKNVLVLEDNLDMLRLVEKIIKEIDETVNVYKVSTLPEAYQIALEHDIGLFLVDIMLDRSIRNDISGLVFVEKIRMIEQYAFVPIIFITSLVDPELHAYRNLHCYGYLEKPILVEEARKLIEQALKYKQQKKEEDTIFFRKDGVIYAVNKKDIIYIKSHAGKITIKTQKDELNIFYRNCKEMMKELDSNKFIQCNRATIVNREFIENVDCVNRIIKMTDGYGIIEIGATMKKSFMEKMNND